MGYALNTAERGCYRTLLDKLITTDIPGYRTFTRMETAVFYLIEERIKSIPHAVGALDGKHIAIRKRNKSGSEYFNYTGLLLPGTFGFSRYRLQVPVGHCGGQWVII